MKGYLPHPVVKAVVFWVLTVCTAVVTLGSILLSWQTIDEDFAYNLFKSAIALAAGSCVFLFINLVFGSLAAEFFTERTSAPLDPAFSDRLKRAKEHGAEEVRETSY